MFWRWLERYDPRYRFIRSLPPGALVLDLGCGPFRTMNKLKQLRPDLHFYGVDMLDLHAIALPNVKFRQCDLEKDVLPFPDEHFDAIFFCHVLEHLHSPYQVIHEIKRTLRPEGLIYIEAPSVRSLFLPSFSILRSKTPFGDDLNFYDNFTHMHPLSKRALWAFTESCECHLLRLGYVRNPLKTLLSPFLTVFGLLLFKRRWLCIGIWELVGWSVYAIAKKSRSVR
jgi:SAM-dependent methyltransferase